jgi:predicted ATPase
VVACLSAKKGGILLIENPEAHLHPQGQTSLGRLLGCCVQDGIQVIVETHSDHLLNGVRLAVKKGELPSGDVAIHFFTRSVEKGDVTVDSPKISNTGRLSSWPSGFFDEWDKSLDQLLEG